MVRKIEMKRKLHFSTLIIIFLECSVMLGINVIPHQGGSIVGSLGSGMYQDVGLGWPFFLLDKGIGGYSR